MQAVTLLLIVFLAADPALQFTLKPDSPLIGQGDPNGAPTTDFCGNARPNPPSIGAFDVNSGPDCENLAVPQLSPPIIIENINAP